MRYRLTALSIATSVALLGACATKEEAAAPNMLVAAKVATPPTLDGNPNDPAWPRPNPSASSWPKAPTSPAARARPPPR